MLSLAFYVFQVRHVIPLFPPIWLPACGDCSSQWELNCSPAATRRESSIHHSLGLL